MFISKGTANVHLINRFTFLIKIDFPQETIVSRYKRRRSFGKAANSNSASTRTNSVGEEKIKGIGPRNRLSTEPCFQCGSDGRTSILFGIQACRHFAVQFTQSMFLLLLVHLFLFIVQRFVWQLFLHKLVQLFLLQLQLHFRFAGISSDSPPFETAKGRTKQFDSKSKRWWRRCS